MFFENIIVRNLVFSKITTVRFFILFMFFIKFLTLISVTISITDPQISK